MIPKAVDWTVLVQCDLYAVKRFIEKDRKAVEIVRPISEPILRSSGRPRTFLNPFSLILELMDLNGTRVYQL